MVPGTICTKFSTEICLPALVGDPDLDSYRVSPLADGMIPADNMEETKVKYGARNKITAQVTSVKSDEIMSLVKFEVTAPIQLASVLTTESVKEMSLRVGDEVILIVKAIHVLPVKE
jgi:molybdopterin-binding protein